MTLVVFVSLSIYLMTQQIPAAGDFEKYRSFATPASIGVVVWILWIIFDKYAWKWKVTRLTGLSKIPDLNGIWSGDVNRLREQNPHSFQMEIHQTFSRISIKTRTTNSTGHSIKAFFLSDDHDENFVLVNFWNSRTKKRQKTEAFEEFKGLSQLSIEREGDSIVLVDYYFTDRTPQTAGKVVLRLQR